MGPLLHAQRRRPLHRDTGWRQGLAKAPCTINVTRDDYRASLLILPQCYDRAGLAKTGLAKNGFFPSLGGFFPSGGWILSPRWVDSFPPVGGFFPSSGWILSSSRLAGMISELAP